MMNIKSTLDSIGYTVSGTAGAAMVVEDLDVMITNYVGEGVQIGIGLITIAYWFYRIREARARTKMYDAARERKEIINEE